MKKLVNKTGMLVKSLLFILGVVIVVTSCNNRINKGADKDLPDYIVYAYKYRFLAEEDTIYFAFTKGFPSNRDVVLVVRVSHNPEFKEDGFPYRKSPVKVEVCEDCLSLVKEGDYICEFKEIYVYGKVAGEYDRELCYFKHWGFGADKEWHNRSRQVIASGDGYKFFAHHTHRYYGMTR